jgi:hypothetical protein
LWQEIEGVMAISDPTAPPQMKALMEAPLTILRQIDGELVCWMEPGMPFPIFTAEVDISQAATEELITSLGFPRAADGTVSISTAPVPICFGWREGKLVFTTNPAGLAGVSHGGGFTKHEEIQRALAAMPDVSTNVCVLLRPAAMMDMVTPLAAMFAPDQQDQLLDYEKRLQEGKAYGYLQVGSDAHGMRVNAAGLLAVIGCAVLASQANNPAALMKIAN